MSVTVDVTRKTDMENILDQLKYKIKKHVKETVLDEQEDLKQEMIVKIIEKVDIMLDEDVPDFFEFVGNLDKPAT